MPQSGAVKCRSDYPGECMTGQAKSATLLAQLRAAIQTSITGTSDEVAYLLSHPASAQVNGSQLDGLPTDMVYQLGAIASISALSIATGSWLQPDSTPVIPTPPDTNQSQPRPFGPAIQPNSLSTGPTVAAPENLTPDLDNLDRPNAVTSRQSTGQSTAATSAPETISANEPSAETQQLAALQAQTPVLQQQLASLQEELRSLQQQQGLTNMAIDLQRFAVRLDTLATQQVTLNEKLTLAQQQQAAILQQLGISSNSQIALRILDSNIRYRALLEELSTTDQQLVTISTQIAPEPAQLQAVQRQYQAQYAELTQEAQRSLQLYLQTSSNAAIQRQSVHLSPTMIQESAYLSNLQQAIQIAHQLQVLQLRQQTVESATPQIQQRQQHAIALLQQYRALTQQIQTTSTQLDQNLNRITTLQSFAQTNPQ